MKLITKIPRTFEEAVELVFKSLEQEDVKYIELHPDDNGVSLHFNVGMHLRNSFKLWRQPTLLKKDFKKQFGLCHADDCSSLIFHAVWSKVLQRPHAKRLLQAHAAHMKKHWKACGINPATGKKI